jgi:predicted SAM-dependent methyltransferase
VRQEIAQACAEVGDPMSIPGGSPDPRSLMKLLKRTLASAFDMAGFEIRRRPKPAVALKTPPGESFSDRFKRYHLGCGVILIDGFLNIDADGPAFSNDVEMGVPYEVGGDPPGYFLKYDLSRGIPASDNSLEVIYHSHFIEHLKDQEGRRFLEECHRCLDPLGVMRIALPDFRLWATNYLANKQEFFAWYRKVYLGDDAQRYNTNASVFAGMLYNYGHSMAYDFETLSALLRNVGFKNVVERQWGVSERIADIASMEGFSERQFESLVVECSKD